MQYGALLIFKKEVTPEEAERRLREIADILVCGDQLHKHEPGNCGFVEEFDEEKGEPVWYVP